MKKCAGCGAEVSDSAVLCPICGGFTELPDKETSENIIDKAISENENTAIADINELLNQKISETTEFNGNDNNNDTGNIVSDNPKIDVPYNTPEKPNLENNEKQTEQAKQKTEPLKESKRKNSDKTPLWLVVLLILLILIFSVICAVMIIRFSISDNDSNETTEASSVVETITDEILSSEDETEEISENNSENDTEEISSVSESTDTTVSDSSMEEILQNNLSQNYSGINIQYDESKNIYTINILDAKISEKILSIQNSSDENNEYDTLTEQLTTDCKTCQNVLLSQGVESQLTLNFINPQNSQILITVTDGDIEYSMIHKAE